MKLHHRSSANLDLNFEAMELPSDPGLTLLVYTAAPGTLTADALKLLASWSATQDHLDQQRLSPESAGRSDNE
jgi:hypothetical protein